MIFLLINIPNQQIPFIANTILPTHPLLQIPSQQPLPNSNHASSNKHISLHTPKKDKELIQLLLRHSIPILRLKQRLHHHLHLLLVFRCQQFLIKRYILILVNAVVYLRLTLLFHPYFLSPVCNRRKQSERRCTPNTQRILTNPVDDLIQRRDGLGSALIEKNVHLLVLDGVLEVAEEILLQVIREVGREEKEGVFYRRCIQVLKEGEEERDSIFLSSSPICTLWSSLLPEFIDQYQGAIAQRFADPRDAREVLREGGVAVHHTILHPQSIPYDSRAVNLV